MFSRFSVRKPLTVLVGVVIAIVLGCIFMIATLVFMILDIFADGDKYL